MHILALDATAKSASVACAVDATIIKTQFYTGRNAAQELPVLLDKVLKDCAWKLKDLDGIAFGCGPGSFTGVRVVASVTQGLAFGANLKVLPVSSLQALAAWAFHNRRSDINQAISPIAVCCIDARMDEVSIGLYKQDAEYRVHTLARGAPRLLAADQIAKMVHKATPADASLIAIGDGCAPLRSMSRLESTDIQETIPPLASEVARLASVADKQAWLLAEQAQPVYLRGADAWKTIDKQTIKNMP